MRYRKKWCAAIFLFLIHWTPPLHSIDVTEPATITYYLYVSDFIDSFIQIPTSNVSSSSSTIASSYLAGRAPIL